MTLAPGHYNQVLPTQRSTNSPVTLPILILKKFLHNNFLARIDNNQGIIDHTDHSIVRSDSRSYQRHAIRLYFVKSDLLYPPSVVLNLVPALALKSE